jgi:hypothetical protein
MCGSAPSGGGIIPFNMSALAPFMPSVFNGPYNAQGALQNEQMLTQKFPWITPPAGQFQGAQPGQYAGAGTGVPSPNPPIPPTVQPATQAPQGSSQFNPAALATGQTNAMTPNSLQAILAVLGAQNLAGGSQ